MTLEQLANLGEFISGIAVIASLVYLAMQIRQNTKTVKSSTLLGNTEIWSSMLLKMSEIENVGAYMYGSSGYGDIRPKEFTQFFLQCRALFLGFENQYYQYCNGSLDEETYKGYERSICEQILAYRGFRMYWSLCRQHFSPIFVKHVDAIISRTPEVDSTKAISDWQQLAEQLQNDDVAGVTSVVS